MAYDRSPPWIWVAAIPVDATTATLVRKFAPNLACSSVMIRDSKNVLPVYSNARQNKQLSVCVVGLLQRGFQKHAFGMADGKGASKQDCG